MLIRYIPTGYRQWAIARNGTVIGAIANGDKGLTLAATLCDLGVEEIESIVSFLRDHS